MHIRGGGMGGPVLFSTVYGIHIRGWGCFSPLCATGVVYKKHIVHYWGTGTHIRGCARVLFSTLCC